MEALDQNDLAMADIYAVKMVVVCMLSGLINTQPDPKGAAAGFLQVATNSVDVFSLTKANPERLALFRMAMQERIGQIVSSASNPLKRDGMPGLTPSASTPPQ